MRFSSAPAWSIPPRRQLKRKVENPGPGTYISHSSSLSRIAAKVGTGARTDISKRPTKTPGPGTYNLAHDRPSIGSATYPLLRFGTEQKFLSLRKDLIPGPGTYTTISEDVQGPKWGMNGKGRTQTAEDKPV